MASHDVASNFCQALDDGGLHGGQQRDRRVRRVHLRRRHVARDLDGSRGERAPEERHAGFKHGGTAVQVAPMKPELKAPGTNPLETKI